MFCRNAIVVNLAKEAPVRRRVDLRCWYCPVRDPAVDRVNAAVGTLKDGSGRLVLTRDKLEEIFEAAAWNV